VENVTLSDSSAFHAYQRERIRHWDDVAMQSVHVQRLGVHYHGLIQEIYRNLVPPGQRIIELGCGRGDLLAALRPAYGVGIDFSREMVRQARETHPGLHFIEADCHRIDVGETFDYVILSDLVNDLWDVQAVFQEIHRVVTPRSRIVINTYSRLWEAPLLLARKLGLGRPTLFQNWLTVEDICGLLNLTDLEMIRHVEEILWPLPTPPLDKLLNRFAAKVWPFRWFALTHFIVARPVMRDVRPDPAELKVSVVVPARNEAGNVEQILRRIPEMGSGTEIIFVEGGSRDETYQVIEAAIRRHPERRCRLFRQTGTGKGDAVRLGFSRAEGEVLIILDADLTVPPEDLPRFLDVLVSGKGEFVNGVRLVYPMEREAMRLLNLAGNKFFSLAFTWLLGQPIKDTLCGTKVLWKADYERIAANRSYFGDFDPFGDFDLLFGAVRLNLKICEVPVRYRDRTYGTTNIHRWRHGWLLLKMVAFATRRIKFT
jgi:ubiquinone/menaquinone biosynthesis C-methylase UbiE